MLEMLIQRLLLWPVLCALLAPVAFSQPQAPFPPDAWPPTIDPNAAVQFVSVGDNFPAPNDNWTPNLSILSGGDQVTANIQIGGFAAKKATGNYLNTADLNQ